jgi:CHAT domain-containing protein
LIHSLEEAKRGYNRYGSSHPEWGAAFLNLEAECLLWRGNYLDVLSLFAAQHAESPNRNSQIVTWSLEGAALARLHRFPEAERKLEQADRLCEKFADPSCGGVSRALGVLATERRQLDDAERRFEDSLSFARAHHDQFLEATALLNLGAVELLQEHFDSAADWSDAAYRISTSLNADDLTQNALGNLGWAYYKLGDSEKSLNLFLEAESRALQLGDISDQASWLTNAGYVYMDARNFSLAEQSFRRALELEQQVNSKEDIYNALRVLARLALQTGDLEKASRHADEALAIARQSANQVDELYPLLVEGQVAARRGDNAQAESKFRAIQQNRSCPVFLKWEAEHSLARLHEDARQSDSADREYRAALATFEAARDSVHHESSQVSFLTNASRIYDDYVHFLVARGNTDDALRWADYSRARTLAEGLGLLAKGASAGPPPLDPGQLARRVGGTLLFYWLGEKQSYLWAVTPQKTSLFTLPAGAEIDAVAQRYRRALAGPQDVLTSADPDGRWLYGTLIAPAQALLKKEARVFVIPDGSLNNLNFETLLASDSKPSQTKLHYWIEDATIISASSLRVLGGAGAGKQKRGRKLLLIGNSVAPNDKYPELPRAVAQMESVARHFPPDGQLMLAREQATPTAYLGSNPGQFSYIHFVAHGTASRLSPLDSAIVLSQTSPANTAATGNDVGDESFKLYARDIIRHPLHADLVAISACYGAGERAYSGEGLVGLSWAFLRAGAHNVVAALWEATDASTELLMDRFYDELDKGANPDTALRAAKLSLLRGGGFHNPFYWAPFQLYAGS